MPSPLDDDPQVQSLHHDDRLDDVKIQYSKSNLMEDIDDKSSLFSSVREIEVTIIEDRSDEIEAHLEVMDNTNRGKHALFNSTTNQPPTDQYEEFSERVVFDKSEIPYYQDDFPNVESYIAIGERIAPKVTEWSRNEPFRA